MPATPAVPIGSRCAYGTSGTTGTGCPACPGWAADTAVKRGRGLSVNTLVGNDIPGRLPPQAGVASPGKHCVLVPEPGCLHRTESFRHEGQVRKRTLCNLSGWSPAHIEGLRGVLKGGTVIPAGQDAFTVSRGLPQGHVAAAPNASPDGTVPRAERITCWREG
jgi:hypothetical protein